MVTLRRGFQDEGNAEPLCAPAGSTEWAGLAGPFSPPGHGLLQVLAWPVVSGRVVEMDVPGYVGRVNGAQRGRIPELGSGCDPAGLADGGLVEQPGVRLNPASPARVAKMAASCLAV